MKKNVAIHVENLGKQYRLGSGPRHHELRDLLVHGFESLASWRKWYKSFRFPEKTFWSLNNVTFNIHQGESVGIIGLNGAGKSTLLKILSRITAPSTGMARLDGRLGALLEVGTGFHQELTGRENIYLYGTILGMNKNEIVRKFDEIVNFAGIPEFIETPVKRYSSGMYVRLAFAVAAHLEPDILFLDEVLSVGDFPFQRKCMDFAKNLQQRDTTIVFVSHNMFSIKSMCSRVIYLKQGRVAFDGPTEEGIEIYEGDSRLSAMSWEDSKPEDWPIIVKECSLFDVGRCKKVVFDHGERMKLRLTYETRRPVQSPNFIVAFIRSDGVASCNYSSELDGIEFGEVDGKGMIELETPPLALVAGSYTIHIIVREKGFGNQICGQIGANFHIRHDLIDINFGVFHEPAQWIIETKND